MQFIGQLNLDLVIMKQVPKRWENFLDIVNIFNTWIEDMSNCRLGEIVFWRSNVEIVFLVIEYFYRTPTIHFQSFNDDFVCFGCRKCICENLNANERLGYHCCTWSILSIIQYSWTQKVYYKFLIKAIWWWGKGQQYI